MVCRICISLRDISGIQNFPGSQKNANFPYVKITRSDAGTMMIEKKFEDVSDMMHDIEQHFAYRAKQEQKELILSRDDDTTLFL